MTTPHVQALQKMPQQLSYLVNRATTIFNAYEKDQWLGSRGDGKWTRLEILGHLIDSAANNHQRFVRALAHPSLTWPGYDQVAHVAVQRYQSASPSVCVALWSAYNLHLSHVIQDIGYEKSNTICSIDQAPAMTLSDLVLDYVAHLEHHLKQLIDPPSLEYSGMPWPPADPNRQWPV
jgi:hypothetical protein